MKKVFFVSVVLVLLIGCGTTGGAKGEKSFSELVREQQIARCLSSCGCKR